MKRLIFYFFVLFSTSIFAQVGINTTTPNAQLDIRSSNQIAPASTDGMLIPKVDTFPASNPSVAQQGMLVYLTMNVGSNQPGFYFWNNPTLTWIPIGNNNNSNWNLTGNTGTNPAINFIGTTDNQDVVFRRFNVFSGRISNSNTFFGRLSGSVSTATNNTFLGTEAGRDNITGDQNVFIGRRSGTFGTTGSNNVLVGNGAGILNEANQNTFVGSFSGNGNFSGANNSFFGYFSGTNTSTGGLNTFLGAFAGNANTTGIQNTIIGSNSNLLTNNLINATAIGSNSLVSTSNSLVLGSVNGINSASATVNVGIGTTSPLDRLHIVGNLRMVDGNQAAGRVLTSDVNGTASWQNASANTWGLTGNAGTNPTTNFIGTIDGQDVVFRRNNVLSGLIGLTNTSFGSTSLFSNTIGTNNTAFGRFSLNSNTSGSFNTAVGGFALSASPTGFNNTAVGYQANTNNTTGQSNSALGQLALSANTSGGFNTAIGRQSLTNNVTGASNTALGALSNVGTDNLTNATAIGTRAQVDTNNSLVLGSIFGINGATSSVNVGIGTTTPARKLHVSNGSSGGTSNFNAGIVLESNTNVYQHFLTPNTSESGLLFGSELNSLNGGIIYNNSNQSMIFRTGGSFFRMVINNLGDVGIGTFFPGGQFELSLNEGRKPSSNFWTIPSDMRLKIVNGIYGKGLSEIIQLKPIRYNYKNTDKKTFEEKVLNQEATGFLAQEVQQIFPEAIGVDRDGYLNFDLHPIMIASINAFKELNSKYEELKNKNEALENKLNLLLSRIEKIENQ